MTAKKGDSVQVRDAFGATHARVVWDSERDWLSVTSESNYRALLSGDRQIPPVRVQLSEVREVLRDEP